jgi:hypothetical protein
MALFAHRIAAAKGDRRKGFFATPLAASRSLECIYGFALAQSGLQIRVAVFWRAP